MNNDLKRITANHDKDIDNEKLMDYLSNALSEGDAHLVEQQMAEDEFVNDAVEGLQEINNRGAMQENIEQLNKGLLKQISKTRSRKDRRRLKDNPLSIIAIILVLLLLVASFMVLKRYFDAR